MQSTVSSEFVTLATEAIFLALLLCSVGGLTLILERSLFWWRVQRWQDSAVRDALNLYDSNRTGAIAKLRRYSYLPLPRILLAAVELGPASPESFHLALMTALQAELPALRRFDIALRTLANLAPLLGLLGTIVGLIDAFAHLELTDLANLDRNAVAAGIGSALLSTAAGLGIAAIVLPCANLFRSFYRRQLSSIRDLSGQLELHYRDRSS